jgi:hypothetical protein
MNTLNVTQQQVAQQATKQATDTLQTALNHRASFATTRSGKVGLKATSIKQPASAELSNICSMMKSLLTTNQQYSMLVA